MKAKQAKERWWAEKRRGRKDQKNLGLGGRPCFLGSEEAIKEERFLGSPPAPALL